ncbi:MAG TPA: hypothetical protein VIR78_02625 [Malonomonas sp.]
MKKTLVLVTLSFLLCLSASAETIKISPTTSLQLTIPSGWLLADEPPQKLLEEMAEHISHEAAEKGQHPTQEQLLAAAKNRLSANEALLYNPNTLAFMTLDFSALKQGERSPSKKSIKLSAKYAGESLEQEEGVSLLTGTSKETKIDGAWYAYRYDANYQHHDEKMAFAGIIGFSAPHWFFFYYTDYLQDPADQARSEQLLESLKIITQ